MTSNLGKSLISIVLITVIASAVGVGGLYYWADNPQWSSELIERGWVKPHARLEKPLGNKDMAAVLVEAQRTGVLSQGGPRERRTDHQTDDGLITLTDPDIELLNALYRERSEAENSESAAKRQSQEEAQAQAEQDGLDEMGWGSDTSF